MTHLCDTHDAPVRHPRRTPTYIYRSRDLSFTFRFKEGDPAQAPTPPPDEVVQAFWNKLAEICQIDLAASPDQILNTSAKMVSAGYTLADLESFHWWWHHKDYRGSKNHEPPTPKQVARHIKQALADPSTTDRPGSEQDRYSYLSGPYADFIDS